MKLRNSAVRLGLLPAGIAIALTPSFASAQEAAAGATTLDRLEVTGSRIRSVDVETAQPIFTVSSEDIKRSGLVSVGDILQNLTVSGTQTFSKAAVLASNPEQGGQYANLYNLGEMRTLVLVNGKRWSSSLAGFTDVDHPELADRAHRSAEGRRLRHLRLRCDCRRDQHHPAQGFRRR